jgi:hypothetical protein
MAVSCRLCQDERSPDRTEMHLYTPMYAVCTVRIPFSATARYRICETGDAGGLWSLFNPRIYRHLDIKATKQDAKTKRAGERVAREGKEDTEARVFTVGSLSSGVSVALYPFRPTVVCSCRLRQATFIVDGGNVSKEASRRRFQFVKTHQFRACFRPRNSQTCRINKACHGQPLEGKRHPRLVFVAVASRSWPACPPFQSRVTRVKRPKALQQRNYATQQVGSV